MLRTGRETQPSSIRVEEFQPLASEIATGILPEALQASRRAEEVCPHLMLDAAAALTT
jgi:hypothetical protein